jgi:short-subunit dehydrogenase
MSEPLAFAKRYGAWAIIAGGSEGLGVAFAHQLAAQGLNLLLIARKPQPLEELAQAVRGKHGCEVRTLALDLTVSDAVERIAAAVSECEIGLLVYNAGADNKVRGFLERSESESETMAALNVLTPMKMVRCFAPAMTERGRGGIVLMSSFASCVGTPGNLVYAATKAFSNVFAEGLWWELGQKGVHVLGAIIGITRTPAMERMGLRFEGLRTPASPEEIVTEVLANIANGPTLHAGGTYEDAIRLRSLPRGDAVRSIAAFSGSVVSNSG